MSFIPLHNQSGINLQQTLSSATANGDTVFPHHPITCASELLYNDDNSFECEHTKVMYDDVRTNAAIRHSIVLLILEPAVGTDSDWKYKSPEQLEEEWNEREG